MIAMRTTQPWTRNRKRIAVITIKQKKVNDRRQVYSIFNHRAASPLRVFGGHLFQLEVQGAKCTVDGQDDGDYSEDLQSVAHNRRNEVLDETEVVSVVNRDHSNDECDNPQDVVECLLINGLHVFRQFLIVQVEYPISHGDEHEDQADESQQFMFVI